MVERLLLAVRWGCLWFVIVVFPDHTHLLFFMSVIERFYNFCKAVVLLLLCKFHYNACNSLHINNFYSFRDTNLKFSDRTCL